MKKLVFLVVALAGCAPTGMVEETLAAEGYEDVEVLSGPALLVCSNSEHYSRAFVATRDGRRVEGAVCCTGLLFGGCTIRH